MVKPRNEQCEAGERLFVRVQEAAAMLAVSRSTLFGLLAEGKLPSVLLSKRTRRIPIAAIRKLADERECAAAAGSPF